MRFDLHRYTIQRTTRHTPYPEGQPASLPQNREARFAEGRARKSRARTHMHTYTRTYIHPYRYYCAPGSLINALYLFTAELLQRYGESDVPALFYVISTLIIH